MSGGTFLLVDYSCLSKPLDLNKLSRFDLLIGRINRAVDDWNRE